ncbi:hypothetical protein J132_06807 [Termitomyces sp. J132]|nr:hypothetical protein J132_06807 [Termitomyces sp. J132]
MVHRFVYCLILQWSGLEFKTHAWMLSGAEEEWEELGGCMNVVVVLELGIREEFILVILMQKRWRLLQLLIYAFGLAIRLQVVGGGGVELHAKQLVELPGEVCHKLWSLVRDVGIGEAMKLLDISPVQVCGAYGRAGGVSQSEVHLLAIQVHHYHDCIITVGVGELYNEVHGSHAPLLHGHGQQM